MTARMHIRSDPRPAVIPERDGRFVELAAITGSAFTAPVADHDRDDAFVAETVRALQASGYTRLTVPANPDGLGATLRLVRDVQAALARACASTTLVASGHRFVTLVTVCAQRRVADVGLIVTSSADPGGVGRRERPRHRPHDPL
jgi:alkylation response protein AidB-like acyl-CoA dehydrogenase